MVLTVNLLMRCSQTTGKLKTCQLICLWSSFKGWPFTAPSFCSSEISSKTNWTFPEEDYTLCAQQKSPWKQQAPSFPWPAGEDYRSDTYCVSGKTICTLWTCRLHIYLHVFTYCIHISVNSGLIFMCMQYSLFGSPFRCKCDIGCIKKWRKGWNFMVNFSFWGWNYYERHVFFFLQKQVQKRPRNWTVCMVTLSWYKWLYIYSLV